MAEPGQEGKFSKAVHRLISQRIASKLGDRPDALEKLAKLGIFDPAVLEELPDGDAVAEFRAAMERFAATVRERPSLLAEAGIRALDLLGSEVGHPAALGTGRAEGIDLSVVFTDLEGFTAFTASEGDASASRLLDVHYRTVDAVVRGRGGRVVKRLGDGHLVTFAAPEAAILGGLELVEAAPPGLSLRAGAHAGTVTPLGEDVVGSVVNLASRVADAAAAGESLITAGMQSRVGDLPGIRFGVSRPVHLKGFSEDVELVPVGRS